MYFRFWWVRIKVLAEKRDWNELERFSKSKKSPIGYEVLQSMCVDVVITALLQPFVEVCIQHNSKNEALKYVVKLPVNRRWFIYMKIG